MTRNEALALVRKAEYREFLERYRFVHVKGPDLADDAQLLAYRHGPTEFWQFWKMAGEAYPHLPKLTNGDLHSLRGYRDIELLVVGVPVPEPGAPDWGETAY